MNWRVIYIIKKILEPRCLKWAHMTHLDNWNSSYGQKKGHESNQSLKVNNHPNFLAFMWCATCCRKFLNKGYNFFLDLISIGGLHTKLWAPKIKGIPTLGISRLPLGSPETKCHLDAGHVAKHKVYYKREGGGFLQVQAMVSLMNLWLLVARPTTKSVPVMH